MKVVLITPNFHQARGNTITVQRIADKLAKLHTSPEIVSITEDNKITTLPPADIYHGFNAFRFFKFKENLQSKINTYVVTITGTDLNHDLFNEQRRSDVVRSVTEAAAVHVFNDDAKQLLLHEVPSVANKIFVIPQDVTDFENVDFPIKKEENTFLFVLPAGIRKVKNVPFAMLMLANIHKRYPFIRLLIVGPILEETEGQLVRKLIDQHKDWIQYIGEVPHQKMGAIYQRADALLNTSHSEGQSTAVMEGMLFGLPVLVSGNDGNRSLVSHRKTGLVYNSQTEFAQLAEHLLLFPDKRRELGSAAQQFIIKHHVNSKEAEELLKIYDNIMEITKRTI